MASETRVVLDQQINTGQQDSSTKNVLMLFLASFLALYFELVVIRYLSTEIRVFAYLKNLTLVASFFGIGLGMILGTPPKTTRRLFPLHAALLFLLTSFATVLHLTHLPVPGGQYVMFGHSAIPSGAWALFWIFLQTCIFFAVVPAILYLIVMFFLVLGGLVGERLTMLKPLHAYGWNLAGSLAGIIAFTALSFSTTPPIVWILVGVAVAIP